MNAKLIALIAVLTVVSGAFWAGYLKGWYAHSDHVNSQAKAKHLEIEKAVNTGEKKAVDANAAANVIYRTVYRNVVKYVDSPNRSVCRFDDDAVRLRQRAIDAANHIPGFDDATVQGK
ncbi:MAG: hypothetical protein ACMX3H_09710 [Sodalis sp. (in: enterobacteria)]|uniref:hypothetical protein n=1 Tax=Sodalis sp. (in: enterobacteria) TaxID=1898979 RepID=UPI0039E54B7A